MKAFGLNSGQIGDLLMCTAAVREFKLCNPDTHFTFCIGKKYEQAAFLFRGLPFVDDIHIWDSYEGFPSAKDKEFLTLHSEDAVFNPFPQHTRPDWYNYHHYVQETCMMNGISPGYNLHCQSAYYPDVERDPKLVTLALFASGNQPEKSFTPEKKEALVARLRAEGYVVAQLGGPFEPTIPGAERPCHGLPYSVGLLLQSRCLITIDTAFSWIGSSYNHPTIGLYGRNYADMKPDRIISHNPVNDGAVYLNRETVGSIELDEILMLVNSMR